MLAEAKDIFLKLLSKHCFTISPLIKCGNLYCGNGNFGILLIFLSFKESEVIYRHRDGQKAQFTEVSVNYSVENGAKDRMEQNVFKKMSLTFSFQLKKIC